MEAPCKQLTSESERTAYKNSSQRELTLACAESRSWINICLSWEQKLIKHLGVAYSHQKVAQDFGHCGKSLMPCLWYETCWGTLLDKTKSSSGCSHCDAFCWCCRYFSVLLEVKCLCKTSPSCLQLIRSNHVYWGKFSCSPLVHRVLIDQASPCKDMSLVCFSFCVVSLSLCSLASRIKISRPLKIF